MTELTVFVVEHPDHTCTLHLFSPADLREQLAWMRDDCIWFEQLGPIAHSDSPEPGKSPVLRGEQDLMMLVRRCSRPMTLLSDWDTHEFLSLDYAVDLLEKGSPKYPSSYIRGGPSAYVRFNKYGCTSSDLVFRSSSWRDESPNKASRFLYISQMSGEIYGLYLDGQPDWRSEPDCWCEKLGEVTAHVNADGTEDVSLEQVNQLASRSSRPMVLLSKQLPLTYLSRTWLQTAVR